MCTLFVRNIEPYRSNSLQVLAEAQLLMANPGVDFHSIQLLRDRADELQRQLSLFPDDIIVSMQRNSANIESSTTFLNLLQETQQMLCSLRLMLNGFTKLVDLGYKKVFREMKRYEQSIIQSIP